MCACVRVCVCAGMCICVGLVYSILYYVHVHLDCSSMHAYTAPEEVATGVYYIAVLFHVQHAPNFWSMENLPGCSHTLVIVELH